MKTYQDERSMRIVGQAWEIRRKLQIALKEAPQAKLRDWLNRYSKPQHTQRRKQPRGRS
ncbi:hypothetical protein PRECH8_01080 [Insulibacter thermoxylanivorax]|uniref:Z-ring formation inhibitor MciZ n=1 Tax=Insulibacter thermoxylanivorax TaxID=2749268 RepID=A0A916Q9S1_9BACL|nr:hypothetical protein PRECH8_01080 [Insulibacter thermoxylanivorax]